MKTRSQEKKKLVVKPFSKISMRLYAIFAIILVIIPELLAELIIALENSTLHNSIPKRGPKWEEDPKLRIAKMSFKELRILASELGIHGYSRDTKEDLHKRLFKKLIK